MHRWSFVAVVAAISLVTGCEEEDAQEGIQLEEQAAEDLQEENLEVAETTEQNEEATGAETEQAGPETSAVVEMSTKEPYGQYLVTPEGKALYMFTSDEQGEPSSCTDACAEAWPPMLTRGEPQHGDMGVDTEKLGTVERPGSDQRQVTYGGWPLYTYARDQGTEITGQDVHGHGGEWYLVGPDGERIEATQQDQVK